MFSLPINKSVLSKIVRCNDDTILFSHKIRESIDSGSSISTKNCKGDNFVVFKDSKKWITNFINEYDGTLDDIVLAYTNKRCDEINRYIRTTIYGEKACQTYIENDIIVFNNFYKISDINLKLVNPSYYSISPVQDYEHKKDCLANSDVFYTSSKAIVSHCEMIKLKIPMFPIKSLFNINKKLDMNFTDVKPDTFTEGKDCPICFDEIKINDAVETGCSHSFCRKCIKTWLEQNDLCPYCRMKISDTKIIFNDDEHLTTLINKFIDLSHNQVYDVWVMDIRGEKRHGTIYVVSESNKQPFQEAIKQIKISITQIKDYLSSKKNISTRKLFIITRLWEYFYYSFIDIFADISYGYCITIHKSQGSTFKDVFVDCKNILNFNKSESLNCLYTAITRASSTLKILI